MPVKVIHLDAFTLVPGKGNPAGIVLSSAGLDDSRMQEIARQVGFNDTAFVLPAREADVRLRYFSPRREVDLCGHATIAAFVAMSKLGVLPGRTDSSPIQLETRTGILPITLEADADGQPIVGMTQAPAHFLPFAGSREALAGVLSIEPEDLHPSMPIVFGSTGRWTLVVPIRSLDGMRRMRPHPDKFPAALTQMPDASIHPFCLESVAETSDMHARHFSSPASGTIEDAVTGTASGVLGAYHREFIHPDRRSDIPLIVEQGYEVGREGYVRVWTNKTAHAHSVRIAGTACLVREILLDG